MSRGEGKAGRPCLPGNETTGDQIMRVVFAGGGTGGHVFPGLAVAEAVKARRPDAEILFLGTGRPIDREVVPAHGYRLLEQSVRPVPSMRKPWQLPAFLWHWFRSKSLASSAMRESSVAAPEAPHPTVVLGLGGYACGPAIRVAASKGIPAAIVNPDLIPGKANLWAEKYVREVYVQFEDSRAHFRSADKVIVTGCPLRGGIAAGDRRAAAAEFGLDPDRLTLLVTGASQGAHSINEALVLLGSRLDGFADRWQVLHLTGRKEFDSVAPRVAGRRIAWKPVAFTQRMEMVYALADLAVGRAGAASLAEFTACGLPSILLPYPYHADQHQRRNAEVLAKAGAAVLVPDRIEPAAVAEDLAGPLLGMMSAPETLAPNREAARRLGRPDAAGTIADRLIALAECRSQNNE